MKNKLNIYLASPYSDPDLKIREQRFNAVCKCASKIMLAGHNVFSPIAHSHPISLYLENSLDNTFWITQDLSFLFSWADEMWILTLPGWDKSEGIKIEENYALKNNIIVRKVSK